MSAKKKAAGDGVMKKLLDLIERVGNKVPHPVVIFLALAGLVVALSHVLYMLGTSASPTTRSTCRRTSSSPPRSR